MNYISMLADANAAQGASGLLSIGILVVMLVVMYFIMIRPQKKKDREDAAMRNNLMVGDEITTIGGIIGRVVSIKDETCVIETSKAGTKIRILKTAIRSVDVPVSATKGYVAPVASAEEQPAEEETPAIEEKTEKKAKKK
ncbi:MAG: preprotein translocase subunit YajC [Clostridia bacterium]|nr:preprotein translocase subunit YajC [Clostridia bacterium]